MTSPVTGHDGGAAAVRAHYDAHLGPLYLWLTGGFETAVAAARADVAAAGLGRGAGRPAVDLGAGIGAHAVALADAGYVVTAIDTCAGLLDVLREHAGSRAVAAVQDDLVQVRRHCVGPQDAVLCMGDTLTHLASVSEVDALVEAVADVLAPAGVFVATFRDYSVPTPLGVQRVIPVRQDDDRMLTCVLEYRDTTVIVHDLVHERTGSGWTLRVSHYPKLRLDPAWVCAALTSRGLAARREAGPAGLVRVVAARPA